MYWQIAIIQGSCAMMINILSILLATSTLTLFAQIETIVYEHPEIIEVTNKNEDPFYNLYLKDYSKALKQFDALLKKNPDYTSALMGKAKCLLALGKTQKAYDNYRIVYDENPTSISALEGLGKSAFYLENFSRAIQFYQQALSLDPENPDLYVSLSRIHMCQGNYERVLSTANKAIILLDENNAAIAYMQILAYFAMAELESKNSEAITRKSISSTKNKLPFQFQFPFQTQSQFDKSEWPYPILHYLKGDLTNRDLLSFVESIEQEIQAHTYIGLNKRFLKDNNASNKHFIWVQEVAFPKSFEVILAKQVIQSTSG
jgi:tetratricopeptide (TPR) repeat protein